MTNDSNMILEVRDLTKTYGDNLEKRIILKQINLEVKKNEFLCIYCH